MLVAPTVVAPITPWSRSVRVKGQLTASKVAIFADGFKIGGTLAASSDIFVPLDPGVVLQPGQKITASQEKDGQASGQISKTTAITVLKEPSSVDLGTIFSRAPLVECGRCLWLEGVVPGADVMVVIGPAPPITITAQWTAVHVDIPKLISGQVVVVKQGKGAVVGPNVFLPPALPQPEGVPVSPPRVTEPLYECQHAFEVTEVRAGAKLTVDHGGNVTDFCFGAVRGIFRLRRRLALGDHVIIKQAFPECELQSIEAKFGVTQAVPPPPWFPYPICAGDRDAEVGGLITGAAIRFLIGRGTNTIVEAEAGEPPHRFNLPPLGNQKWLGVQQAVCPSGPWSEVAWTELVAVGSVDSPGIEEPVHECGHAVGVVGLSAGTRVYVISSIWGGPIGDVVALGDAFTDVPLEFRLIAGDRLSLDLVRCGHMRALPDVAVVKPAPEELFPPLIFEPLDDTGGTITVERLVPGAFCDVEQVATPNQNQGVLLVSHPVTRSQASIPVPPLSPGLFVRCRQRLCGRTSRLSITVKTGDRSLRYETLSADRIVALTGIRGHGMKPARYDTTKVGLIGTDLGIPVVHGGVLYFLFGDCDGEKCNDDVMDADADPIAWTTDPPDWPGGPHLNFLTGSRGLFHRLHVDGLGRLGNFEVPTGAFSYHGRLYVFIAREKVPENPPGERMNTSHLAVTKQPGGVTETLELVCDVASTLSKNPPAPAGRWLVHVSPTVVRCQDWPGLPQSSGDGLVMFGTELYHASNLFLAFCPLVYSSVSVPLGPWGPYTNVPPPIPHPSTWLYFVNGAPATSTDPANWRPNSLLPASGPTPLLSGVGGLGEVSAGWHAKLRRWLVIHQGPDGAIVVRAARAPWGPWSNAEIVFDGVNSSNQAGADNFQPGHQFMNLKHDWENRNTAVYAPYLIPAWTSFDRSTRAATLYYTLSTEHPPYNVQLMRARLLFS